MANRTTSGVATAQQPVVVVGGGIAGLTAAWELQRRGVPVKVIEQDPRVGGRIHSTTERGARLEVGMQFYYSAYSQTKRLLREFGLYKDLVPIHIRGLMYWQDRIAPFDKTKPWLKLLSTADNLRLQAAVAKKLIALLRISPFNYRANDRVNQTDVVEYFMKNGNEALIELAIRPMVNSYAFCEPEGHSLGMLLRIMKLGGLASTHGLKGGNDGLPAAMAKKLDVIHGRVTDIVVENGSVRYVEYEQDGKRVSLNASSVICAARAPQAAKLLDSVPEIADSMKKLKYSSVLLINLHLDRPIPGEDWVYVFSRKSGHKAAFGIDLTRRSPIMHPDSKAVVQVNVASPVSDQMLNADNESLYKLAAKDMSAFLPNISDWIVDASVTRRPLALPSFHVGMHDQVREIEKSVANIGGLHLAGDYLRSPLCEGAVRAARKSAKKVMKPGSHAKQLRQLELQESV
jgi:protoporphyrinogen/coproporphyrinogen III oxidase